MEFGEKLQELRKQKGLTQEELAQMLYVSRTAISKWESGRGYPNIDSIKAIAKFFYVSIDVLLSGDEVLTIAEEDNKKTKSKFCDLIFGLLDVCALLLLVLPFFGRRADGAAQGVSLLSLSGIAWYLRFAYFDIVSSLTVCGILLLALQNSTKTFWVGAKYKISLILNVFAVMLFVLGLQPYAAVLQLVFLAIKILILTKKQ